MVDDAQRKALALPFPIFDTASAALRFVPESSASATSSIDDAVWEKLEQNLIDHGLGERTLADGSRRKRKRPTSQTSRQARQVPIDQVFWLDVGVRNPLGIELAVDEIRPVLQLSSAKSNDAEATEHVGNEHLETEECRQESSLLLSSIAGSESRCASRRSSRVSALPAWLSDLRILSILFSIWTRRASPQHHKGTQDVCSLRTRP